VIRTADVVVIGAGVIGSACAWALARAGLSVTLLERDAVGAHASSVAAGMLAPFAEAHGREEHLPLGVESLERFPALVDELRERTGIDPRLALTGLLRVAHGDDDAASLRARAAALAAHGVAWWDGPSARAHEPSLAPDVRGALWSPREGSVDAALLTRAFAQAARSAGASILEGQPARALLREGDRVVGLRSDDGVCSAARVVLASGPWAGDEIEGAPALPIRPVKGQLAEVSGVSLRSILWDESVYLVPRPGERVLAGATSEEVGFDRRVTDGAVRGLLASAARLAPPLGPARLEGARAGLRPASPDGLPLVGAAPGLRGLLLAVGHHRNGILLSGATAECIAALVQGAPVPPAARSFAPERFLPADASRGAER
jgi:glycine oxidase